MRNLIITVFALIINLALSCAVTIALVYLITLCFGLEFALVTATGVWLILSMLKFTFVKSQRCGPLTRYETTSKSRSRR